MNDRVLLLIYCCFGILYIVSCHNYMYYVCETWNFFENAVKRSEFGYARD